MFFSDDHKYPETIITGMLKILKYILHIPILIFNRRFSQDKQYAPFSFSVHKSFNNYSCGLSTATIEYSSLSVCLCVCLSVCVHDNSKNKGSIDVKLEHTVVYENSSDEFDIGHCPIKVKVTV